MASPIPTSSAIRRRVPSAGPGRGSVSRASSTRGTAGRTRRLPRSFRRMTARIIHATNHQTPGRATGKAPNESPAPHSLSPIRVSVASCNKPPTTSAGRPVPARASQPNPRARTGPARRPAGTATSSPPNTTRPKCQAMMGKVASCAARVTPSGARIQVRQRGAGSQGTSAGSSGRKAAMIVKVAAKLSWNPTSRAFAGEYASSASAAMPSPFKACPASPRRKPRITTAAIRTARTTDGRPPQRAA